MFDSLGLSNTSFPAITEMEDWGASCSLEANVMSAGMLSLRTMFDRDRIVGISVQAAYRTKKRGQTTPKLSC